MNLTSINVNNTLVASVDSEPIAGSGNLVKSGGVTDYTYKKILNDVLSTTIKELGLNGTIVDFTNIVNGYYISFGGTVSYSDGYAHTQPIFIEKGKTIVFYGTGYQSKVAMISSFDAGSQTYTPLVVSNSEKTLYKYYLSEDKYIVFSFRINSPYFALTSGDVETNVSKFLSREIYFNNAVYGRYIDFDGHIGDKAIDYRYTPHVSVKRHQKISFTAAGYLTKVSMISKYNGEDIPYTPLVVSIDSNVHTYTYLADEDMEITFSYNSKYEHSGTIELDLETIPNIEDVIDYTVFFPKMAVIGDSLSSGTLYYNNAYNDRYGDSWLSFIAKHSGSKRNHYSQGGLTAKAWIDNYTNKLQSDSNADIYFIALGTNDAWLKPYPIGSAEDAAGTNTFAGWYKQIIETVREKAPNATIMCISLYRNDTTWNSLINKLADLYPNTYYIDFANNSAINTDTGGVYSAGSHFTTIGYKYVANVILKQLNSIISHNIVNFKFYGYENMQESQYEF